MSENTSATGGYLKAVTAPVEGRELTDILRPLFMGITGITDPAYIRALWQPLPTTIPEPTVTWLAFGLQTVEEFGGSPYIEQAEITEGEGDEQSEVGRMHQHETIEINVQVYGLHCMAYVNAIRDGLQVGQNRAELRAQGLNYKGASNVTRAPEQVNSRWYDRADITLTFTRQAERTYRTLSFVQAVGEINEQEFATEIPE